MFGDRSKRRMNKAAEDNTRFIELTYAIAFGRDPDPEGLGFWQTAMANGTSHTAFLEAVAQSDEFKKVSLALPATNSEVYTPEQDVFMQSLLNEDVRYLNERMTSNEAPPTDTFDRASAEALPVLHQEMPSFKGQDEYFSQHRRRFLELSNIVSCLSDRFGPTETIMDVGWSANTFVLKALFHASNIIVIDRPDMPIPPSFSANAISVDLQSKVLDPAAEAIAEVIIFSEVIEHLLANPVKVITYLLTHIKKGGHLIITTPNFFSHAAVASMSHRDNPQPIYPYGSGLSDAPHFHVREYGMRELLRIVQEAGGAVASFFFSDCWEDAITAKTTPRHEWSNIVVIARKV